MGTTYQSAYVKCPFYITDHGKSIICEGVRTECSTEHRFRRKEIKDKHLQSFCCKEYKKCRMYKLLEKKYDEEP